MPKCVAAILAKNEAHRYLRATIDSLKPLCDTILLLDDGSTDDTRKLAEGIGCLVRERNGVAMWGNESPARQELWHWGTEVCKDGWLYISDADHITKADPTRWRLLLSSWAVNAWAMPLYDCWDSPTQYRVDGFWQGYQHPRPWLFRPQGIEGVWNDRGMHCGHAPLGPWIVGHAEGVRIEHRGWMKKDDRKAKHLLYAMESGKLTDWEQAHLHSVLA